MDGSMEDVLAKLREASMPKKGATAGASREPGGAGVGVPRPERESAEGG